MLQVCQRQCGVFRHGLYETRAPIISDEVLSKEYLLDTVKVANLCSCPCSLGDKRTRHRSNTMATCVAGLSEAMLRPGSWSLGDKGTHYIKTIKNSSNHLATLINDILDAAAMAKGKLVIKQETVSCCSPCTLLS